MAKDFLKSDPIGDFEQQFNQDYNQLIRKVHKGLSTKKQVNHIQDFLQVVGRHKLWVLEQKIR